MIYRRFSDYHAFAGHFGGLSTSSAKVAAARTNGLLGGRPCKHGFYSKRFLRDVVPGETQATGGATSFQVKPKRPAERRHSR